MNKNKVQQSADNAPKKTFSFEDNIAVIIFFLYLLVDFIPTFGSYTFGEPQWLYLTVLNFCAGFYLYYNKCWVQNEIIKKFFTSKIIVLYLLFLLLCGISIFVGINFNEGFITILRYSVTFSALAIFFMLFYNKQHLYLTFAGIISILLLIQCFPALKIFAANYDLMSADAMIAELKHHHDNKNIFASSILIKLPFVLFCVIKTTKWRQYFFSFIFFCAVFTILFLGARAIMAGLVLQIMVISFGILILRFYKKINFTTNYIALIAIILIIGVTIYKFNVVNQTKNAYFKNKTCNINIKANATHSNKSNNNVVVDVRSKYWQGAIKTIQENPILGCGLGNWKLESLQHEVKWKPDNVNAVHAHNDFLQVAAETGILNGLIYFTLFIGLLVVNIKTILQTRSDDSVYAALFLIGSIIALMVDNMFNFPLSRPTIQILFALLILFTLLNYYNFAKSESVVKTSWSKIIIFIILLLSFASIYPNYLLFKFFQAIEISKKDYTDLNLSFAEINSLFANFPDVDETGTPIAALKAKYLLKENKLDQALIYINKAEVINPYDLYAKSQKVDYYNQKLDFQNAAFQAKNIYQSQPKYQVFFERYIQALARLKDTTAITATFKNLNVSQLNAAHYSMTFGCLLKAGYDKNKSFEYIKNGLLQFPTNEILLKIRNDFNKKPISKVDIALEKALQTEASKTNDYTEIEKYYLSRYSKNNLDYAAVENLGIAYFQQKKYTQAIEYLNKVVIADAFKNGKAEYIMAVCYSNLNNKIMTCQMATLALKKNYQEAAKIINASCN